jgi:hypothetical protein
MLFSLLLTNLYAQTFSVSSSLVEFHLPYTLGTHVGKSSDLSGTFNLQKGGEFKLPIETLKTGKEKMDCHMYESLGLDYSKSKFPDEHICDDNKIPAGQPYLYKNIILKVSNVEILEKKEESISVKAKLTWLIHGLKIQKELSLMLEKSEKGWSSKTKFNLKLSEFGIIVKNFLFIKVKDNVEVITTINWRKS